MTETLYVLTNIFLEAFLGKPVTTESSLIFPNFYLAILVNTYVRTFSCLKDQKRLQRRRESNMGLEIKSGERQTGRHPQQQEGKAGT